MPVFVSNVVEDLRHGRETWPVRFVLAGVSLAIALLMQNFLVR